MIKVLKALGLWILQGIIGAVFVLCGAIMLAEWFSGCGETYVDSAGRTHTHQCVFIGR